MTTPEKNSNLPPWKWDLIGAGSTVVLALAGFGFWNLLNPKNLQFLSVASATPENSVAKKLIGQWELQDAGASLKLIFTPEGKLYIWDRIAAASEARYQIDLNFQPKHLDVLRGGQITRRLLFDFTANGQLRLELNNSDTSRPTSFTSKAGLFRKVSEQTTLPPNVKATSPEDEAKDQINKARQSEAKQYVGSMNRAQQAFYAEQARFTSILEELGMGIKSETENYSYSIVLSHDKRFVQSIGLAKRDGLKSYTGIVYLVKSSGGEQMTSAIFCESNQPSKELPETPVVTNNTDKLECPLGYSSY
jgi:type II secretory pathway pseudopilin PulG